jgi:hypothetical protein
MMLLKEPKKSFSPPANKSKKPSKDKRPTFTRYGLGAPM